MRCEVFHCQEELRLPEELLEDRCEENVEDGPHPCENVERTGRWYLAHRKVEVEAADGGSNRQERISSVVSFYGGE